MQTSSQSLIADLTLTGCDMKEGSLRLLPTTVRHLDLTCTNTVSRALKPLYEGLDVLILVNCFKLNDDIERLLPQRIRTLVIYGCPNVTVDLERTRKDIDTVITKPNKRPRNWGDLLDWMV